MWNFRDGQNTVLTRKQAEELGLNVPSEAIGIRLSIEPLYKRSSGTLWFSDGFDTFTSSATWEELRSRAFPRPWE